MGSYKLNGFNFTHNNINKRALKNNNQYLCYTSDIVTDFEADNYHEAYSTLFQGKKMLQMILVTKKIINTEVL